MERDESEPAIDYMEEECFICEDCGFHQTFKEVLFVDITSFDSEFTFVLKSI